MTPEFINVASFNLTQASMLSLFSLEGKYVYGDWCTGDIWALTYDGSNNVTNQHLLTTGINITSFGLLRRSFRLHCGSVLFSLLR